MPRFARYSNRSIIGLGLLLCILGAVVVAYLLGAFEQLGLLS